MKQNSKQKIILIKILVEISRIILGLTFMFSGFVKSVDPWGFAYKIEDYFTAFGFSYFSFLSFPISAGLSALEFILGAFMLLGIYRVWTSRLLLAIMSFMTILTLYLAIANPVDDCGCFGDAIIISNWATFYKNIVLTICAIITFKYAETIKNFFTGKSYWLVLFYIIIFSVGFVIRNYIYEPFLDFRPYSVGTTIEEKMTVPKDKQEVTELKLVYAKDGVKQEFTQENYPWEDSTWTYVSTITHILKKGEEPTIKDFKINKLEFDNSRTKILGEEDITAQILEDSIYTFLIISPFLEGLNNNYLSNLEDIDYYCKENKYKCYFLTSSGTDDILSFMKNNLVFFDFCLTDERVLKTICRTNPGLLLLKDGVIINKWADIELPDEADLNAPLDKLAIGHLDDTKNSEKKKILFLALLFFVPLFVVKITDFIAFNKIKDQNKQHIK